MAANYDNSAWFYDRLSRLVFGKALVNAQIFLLQHIPQNSNILIAGGGTGWILNELTRIHPSSLSITYVEVSANMIALAQKRNIGDNKVIFINKPVEEVKTPQRFDVVITPFLFDNFSDETMRMVFAHMHDQLRADGMWLYADFEPSGKRWQSLLVNTMLLFFRVLCGIESSRLPDVNSEFENFRYGTVAEKKFYGDLVVARVWRQNVS